MKLVLSYTEEYCPPVAVIDEWSTQRCLLENPDALTTRLSRPAWNIDKLIYKPKYHENKHLKKNEWKVFAFDGIRTLELTYLESYANTTVLLSHAASVDKINIKASKILFYFKKNWPRRDSTIYLSLLYWCDNWAWNIVWYG